MKKNGNHAKYDPVWEEIENDDRFVLKRYIGGGAFGSVWAAINIVTGDKVAIKRIKVTFSDFSACKRIIRELRLLHFFKHENIISTLNYIVPSDQGSFSNIFIVQELMHSDLRRIPPLSADQIVLITYQILCGLKYIHSAGVLHRDIKPDNILINSNNDVKICDFGMGRARGSSRMSLKLTRLEDVATRWLYQAPEGILNPKYEYSSAVDIWSVGCIIAEMLTGQVLFKGVNRVEMLKLIVQVVGFPSEETISKIGDGMSCSYLPKGESEPSIPLEEVLKDAEPSAINLVKCMLKFDPEERITVEEALSHDYLNEWHDPEDEPYCIQKFKEEQFDRNLSSMECRDYLYNELVRLQKE